MDERTMGSGPEEDLEEEDLEEQGKSDDQEGKDEVDEQSEESFPASDPPSY